MGFARLHFANDSTLTIGNVIRDIVGVIAGDYTATNQLLAATQNLSEIRNTAGRGNWTKVYPSTNTNTIPQVLSTTCLNGTTKFIRIGGLGTSDLITNTTGTDNYGYATSATVNGIAMQCVTAATSATAVTNPSFVNQSSTANANNFITGNFVWLSWSSRHCLILGNQAGTGTTTIVGIGCFEFNELSIYDYRNVAPFINWQLMTSTFATGINPTTGASLQSSISIMNHYNPSTTETYGYYNLTAGITNVEYNSITAGTASSLPSSYTKNSSGAVAAILQPLFWHQHQIGIPHAYISDLSKVYRTTVGIGNPGDTMTVGADTYVYFPIRSGDGLYFSLAVLRA